MVGFFFLICDCLFFWVGCWGLAGGGGESGSRSGGAGGLLGRPCTAGGLARERRAGCRGTAEP